MVGLFLALERWLGLLPMLGNWLRSIEFTPTASPSRGFVFGAQLERHREPDYTAKTLD